MSRHETFHQLVAVLRSAMQNQGEPYSKGGPVAKAAGEPVEVRPWQLVANVLSQLRPPGKEGAGRIRSALDVGLALDEWGIRPTDWPTAAGSQFLGLLRAEANDGR